MKPSLRLLLPVLAGSALLFLSGCEVYDEGPGYRHHAVYREGYRNDYDRGYHRDRYVHEDRYDRRDYHPHYEDRSRVVVVAPRPAPYVRSYPHSRPYVAPGYRRPQTNVVVVSTQKPKKKDHHHD